MTYYDDDTKDICHWHTINEFLSFIHKYDRYLILRNYEGLLDVGLSLKHADIDILCDNALDFISFSKIETKTTPEDTIHRKVLIDNTWVDVDVREIGDGYFDRNWEKKVLDRRKLYSSSFYVMSDADYFYTLLYHACVHKHSISTDYHTRLDRMAKEMNIDFSPDSPRTSLENYMRKQGYKYEIPVYGGAIFNLRGSSLSLVSFDIKRIINRFRFIVMRVVNKTRRLLNG